MISVENSDKLYSQMLELLRTLTWQRLYKLFECNKKSESFKVHRCNGNIYVRFTFQFGC